MYGMYIVIHEYTYVYVLNDYSQTKQVMFSATFVRIFIKAFYHPNHLKDLLKI